MDIAKILNDMLTEQVANTVITSRELFTDLLEEYLKGKKVTLEESDKRSIERMFSDTVQTYMVAQLAAITAFAVYAQAPNDEILTTIMPVVLDKVETDMKDQVPASLVKLTSDLPAVAKKALESPKEKSDIAKTLIADVSEIYNQKHLRAIFDATILNFMRE